MPDFPLDQLGRPLRDLRISVTDRCNFRCTYCMPKAVFGSAYRFLPRTELLTFDEITRLTKIFAQLGVQKVRLTGGEPLLRRGLDRLIAQLSAIPQIADLTLTTNGSRLAAEAAALRSAGLRRLTVSLDSLDDSTFCAMNDADFPVSRVLHGIDLAVAVGFAPLKINMVVQRGVNEQDLLPMVRRFQAPEFALRFIEYMDVGNSNRWQRDQVVTSQEILERVREEFPLDPLPPNYPGEVARRFRHRFSGGEIGMISSVSEPFCRGCTRARLSADGRLFTCLFAGAGFDLKTPLRAGASDQEMHALLSTIWSERTDRYSELRSAMSAPGVKAEMSLLGG